MGGGSFSNTDFGSFSNTDVLDHFRTQSGSFSNTWGGRRVPWGGVGGWGGAVTFASYCVTVPLRPGVGVGVGWGSYVRLLLRARATAPWGWGKGATRRLRVPSYLGARWPR